MANRSTKISGRIRATLGAINDDRLTDSIIFQTMDDISRRIAEDTLCLEENMNVTISSGGASYDLATAGGVLLTEAQYGTVSNRTDVIINSTNTAFVWDKAFTQTYVDSYGATVPSYRFVVQEARIGGTGATNEEITIVSQSLTGMTLKSTSDNTLVRFIVLSVASSIENPAGATSSGFFRMRYIQLPASFQFQLEEVSPINRDAFEREPLTSTGQSPLFFSLYNNVITFYPEPIANATYVIYYYKIPTTNISASAEPETPSHFDAALFYGATAELAPVVGSDQIGYYSQAYSNEIGRAIGVQRTRKSVPHQIFFHEF